ncbi:MAG: flagellar biosynthesis protein [Lachnospiraceae bacterium]|nr:flagellar biosynthesis protein [Lachnospiraceae bacterium]
MQERIQGIIKRITDWWKRFNIRQKALLISIVAVVAVAIAILTFVMTRPKMVELISCESAKEASTVKELLETEKIKYETSSDGLSFSVNAEDEANASILLGSNDIPTKGYSIDNVFDGGFSSTEADKTKKYQLYLEERFSEQLSQLSNVETASVSLSMPSDDGTIISKDDETYASVILTLDGEMDEDQAAGIAKYIATEVGNDTTDRITIMDSNTNLLFSGGDSDTSVGVAGSNLSYQTKMENLVKGNVKDVIMGTNVYDNVEVGLNLALNFNKEKVTDHQYYVEEGQEQGYLDKRTTFESESTGRGAATPGTDTNDGTEYVMQDGEVGSSTVSDVTEDFSPSERITETEGSIGNIEYDNSSITVVCSVNRVYNEDTLKSQGQLDDLTFDEFAEQNSDRQKIDVDEDLLAAVANATGIPQDNISIVAYEVPYFQWSDGSGRTVSDYLQIALAVLIFALLGFVVFRSTRKEPEEIIEPELSVETLLETTKEAEGELEDIGLNEKSESRILIEKFVDENPEAVAALLRNWLNDEWD